MLAPWSKMLSRTLVPLALIACCLGCPDRSAREDDEALARYLAGIAHLHEARFGDAVLELKAAVKLDPSRTEAHHSLGEAYMGVLRHADAEASFRQALMLEPDKYLSHMGLGNALRLQGRASEAVEAYREAARRKPDHPAPHLAMGEVLRDAGEEAEAARALAEAVRLSLPEDVARPLGMRARALLAAGDFEASRAVFKEVVELLPDNVEAWLGLAEATVRAGRLEEAIEAYETASRLDPDDTITMQLLAAVHEALDRDEDAIETYQKALQTAPKSPRIWAGFARLHLDAGRRNEALEATEQALAHLGGDDPDLIRSVADLLAALEDALRAAELYRLLLLEADDDASLWVALARQLDALERTTEVARICARLSELAERNGVSSGDLAWCAERTEP